ncbi:glycerate kinase [Balneola sp. MJW-20]|uniref:glycerate kinase type-2 family protein n=1 Tax=Gracilimonas aurantiaca TaxID=3234185 RepID=UPI0034661266
MDIFEKHRKELESVAIGVALGDLVDVNLQRSLVELNPYDPVYVIGAGKGVVHMARQVENYFAEQIADGIVIAPEPDYSLDFIQVFEGYHPLPNRDSVAATYEITDMIRNMPPNAQVVALFTGGASSLMCMPADDLEISDLQDAYHYLLNSGASIHEMNVVRKHLSKVKGGKLARMMSDLKVWSFMLSDVPGDNPSTIGSGPTVPDNSDYEDAITVLRTYEIWDDLSPQIRRHLNKGKRGECEPVLSFSEYENYDHSFRVISGQQSLVYNVADYFKSLDYNAYIHPEHFEGSATEVSKMICSKAITILSKDEPISKPAALIFNGESQVKVIGKGKGGRNQHLALIAALSVEGQHAISLLSFGTDGVDGSTDAAGAIINSHTTLQARKKKLDPESYLLDFNSYEFHKEMDTLVRTGQTGTNVMDLVVVLVGKNPIKE